jgi:hypothetical protein
VTTTRLDHEIARLITAAEALLDGLQNHEQTHCDLWDEAERLAETVTEVRLLLDCPRPA